MLVVVGVHVVFGVVFWSRSKVLVCVILRVSVCHIAYFVRSLTHNHTVPTPDHSYPTESKEITHVRYIPGKYPVMKNVIYTSLRIINYPSDVYMYPECLER